MERRTPRKLKPVEKNCPFCHKGANPNYQEVESLKAYISERGKILGKDRTGLCAKHQRRLSVAIKRARFLALLPFTTQIK